MIDVIGGLALGAAMAATYALGHYHGRAYVSDRTFGPVAAGLVRIEAAADRLEELADEPIPYLPVERPTAVIRIDGPTDQELAQQIRRIVRTRGGGDAQRGLS